MVSVACRSDSFAIHLERVPASAAMQEGLGERKVSSCRALTPFLFDTLMLPHTLSLTLGVAEHGWVNDVTLSAHKVA